MPAAAVPGGGLSSSPPANPAFSLLPCPLSPLPLPQWGRGILSFLMQRAPPLASPVAEPGRHLQPLPSKASGGVAGFLPRPTPRQPSAMPTQINAAPPPVNTIIEESSWGFGGFFQEAPNVPSLSRSPVLKRLTGQDKPALSVVLGLFTEGYGYACGGSGQPRRAAGR